MTRSTPLQCTSPAASGEPVISLSNAHPVIMINAFWQNGCCCDCAGVLAAGTAFWAVWECILMHHLLWLST